MSPLVTAASDPAGTTNWTVTFTDSSGATKSQTFTVNYNAAAALGFTNLTPSTVTTNTAGYQATLTATGANFTNLSKIVFAWTGATTGSSTWNKGDSSWNAHVTINSDTSITLTPIVTAASDAAGTANWTVTVTDTTGATKSQSFSVSYNSGTALSFTNLTPATVTTSTAGYQATLTATGTNFTNLTKVAFSWSGASSGSSSWSKGDASWNSRVAISSDTTMTLTPVITAASDAAGTTNWTVTLTDSTGATKSQNFAVVYGQPTTLSFTGLAPSSVTTSTAGYQASLAATGTNFNNLTKIVFAWSGASSGTSTWSKGDSSWNARVNISSDTSMTLTPIVTAASDAAGITNWTVTLTDSAGAIKSQGFAVNFGEATGLTFTKLDPNSVSATTPNYQASLVATGSNFTNLTKIAFSWTGATSGNSTWSKGDSNWNNRATFSSDTSLTLKPIVTGANDPTGTTNWTVTLTDTSGTTKSQGFTVTNGPAGLTFTNLTPSTIKTTTAGYQPTLNASGTNFNAVTKIDFSWTGSTSGSSSWAKGDSSWTNRVAVSSDTTMTISPIVTQASDPSGATSWTVTLTDNSGAKKSQSFSVTYTNPTVHSAWGTTISSFNSVVNRSNFNPPYDDTTPDDKLPRNKETGINTGLSWQCVEYVNRYYFLVYHGIDLRSLAAPGDPVHGINANQFYGKASQLGLLKVTDALRAGDILCFDGGGSGTSLGTGHVAIVRNVDASAGKVWVIQQNVLNGATSADGVSTDDNFSFPFKVSNGQYDVVPDHLGNPAKGIVYTYQGALRYPDQSSAAPVLAVSPSETVTLEAGASGTVTFKVSNTGGGTMNWYGAVTSGNWLAQPKVTTGLNAGSYSVGYTPNTTGTDRSATVTFTAPDAARSKVEVTVVQRGSSGNNAAGVDVHAANGALPWSTASVQFAYLKATESNYNPDSQFANSVSAIGRQMVIGAYHFATPLFSPAYVQTSYDHTGTAQDEAANFWKAAKNVIGTGYLPPALDVEDQVVTWVQTPNGFVPTVYVDPLSGKSHDPSNNPLPNKPAMSAAALAQWIQDWMNTLSDLQTADGRTPVAPVLYCSRDYAKQLYPFLNGKIKLWIADWDSPAGHPDTTGWADWPWLFHQWTSHGTFVGHNPIDVDVFNGDATALTTFVSSGATNGAQVFAVTASAGPNGSVNPTAPQALKAGDKATFTAMPANGFLVDQWLLNGKSIQTGGTSLLVGAPTSNETLVVTFKPASSFAGTYHGALNGGSGVWGLNIDQDGTGTYIAYVSSRGSAIVQPVTVDTSGHFSATSTELRPSSTSVFTQSVDGGSAPRAAAAASVTLSGQIANGFAAGQLEGTGITFSAASDSTGSAQTTAGFYTASAMTASGGTTYTIVGASGQAVVVTTSSTSVDGGTATVDASGHLSATTTAGGTVAATIDPNAQTISVAVSTAGSSAPPVTLSGVSSAVSVTNRLVNISTRGVAGTSSQALIAGFVISGTTPKQVLIRGIGPTLGIFGVPGFLVNPKLQLFRGDGTQLTENDDWGSAANVADITAQSALVGAFPLATGSKDSALLLTLDPGAYTAVATGADGGAGVALVEVYELLSSVDAPKLINISTRGQVNTGSGVLIAGFVVNGNAPKKLLIRAIGPTLATSFGLSGALSDPLLALFDSAGKTIAQNDNWGSSGDGSVVSGAAAQVGAFGLQSGTKDSVMLVTLPPGGYTAQVSGVNNTTGVALVEVYEVP